MKHPHSDKWVPYRDPVTGEIVTVTWPQVSAILHAMTIVDDCRRTQSRVWPGDDEEAVEARRCPPLRDDIPVKSRALGRLLIDGKPLFKDMPPFELGAAAYWVWDEENEQG